MLFELRWKEESRAPRPSREYWPQAAATRCCALHCCCCGPSRWVVQPSQAPRPCHQGQRVQGLFVAARTASSLSGSRAQLLLLRHRRCQRRHGRPRANAARRCGGNAAAAFSRTNGPCTACSRRQNDSIRSMPKRKGRNKAQARQWELKKKEERTSASRSRVDL